MDDEIGQHGHFARRLRHAEQHGYDEDAGERQGQHARRHDGALAQGHAHAQVQGPGRHAQDAGPHERQKETLHDEGRHGDQDQGKACADNIALGIAHATPFVPRTL